MGCCREENRVKEIYEKDKVPFETKKGRRPRRGPAPN